MQSLRPIWSAAASEARRRFTRNVCRVGNKAHNDTNESGVALRLPPHSIQGPTHHLSMSIQSCTILAGLCLWSCVHSVLAQPSNSPSGQSPENAGKASAGEKAMQAEAEVSSASTVSQPAPFSGPWIPGRS